RVGHVDVVGTNDAAQVEVRLLVVDLDRLGAFDEQVAVRQHLLDLARDRGREVAGARGLAFARERRLEHRGDERRGVEARVLLRELLDEAEEIAHPAGDLALLARLRLGRVLRVGFFLDLHDHEVAEAAAAVVLDHVRRVLTPQQAVLRGFVDGVLAGDVVALRELVARHRAGAARQGERGEARKQQSSGHGTPPIDIRTSVAETIWPRIMPSPSAGLRRMVSPTLPFSWATAVRAMRRPWPSSTTRTDAPRSMVGGTSSARAWIGCPAFAGWIKRLPTSSDGRV